MLMMSELFQLMTGATATTKEEEHDETLTGGFVGLPFWPFSFLFLLPCGTRRLERAERKNRPDAGPPTDGSKVASRDPRRVPPSEKNSPKRRRTQ